jgi:uridine kinase
MKAPLSPYLIGIGGGTGAGKTMLSRKLAERYGTLGVSIVDQDSYYQDHARLTEEEKALINYDEPSAIDHELLFAHLQSLLAGGSVPKPQYCFAEHARRADVEIVQPAPILILEGLFALADPRIRSLMDLKLYVEADPDLRFIRRLRRDLAERGRTVDSVIRQYLEFVRPMHQIYVDPTKACADIVVDGGAESIERVLPAIDQALAVRCRRPMEPKYHLANRLSKACSPGLSWSPTPGAFGDGNLNN